MDVDLSALKALERDKEISMEVLLAALSEALLNAYEKTPGAVPGARVEVERRTGKVSVRKRTPGDSSTMPRDGTAVGAQAAGSPTNAYSSRLGRPSRSGSCKAPACPPGMVWRDAQEAKVSERVTAIVWLAVR